MSKTPFMPLWVNDFLGDTLDLDAKEVGAYMLILMSMWSRGGTLPNDEKKLKRVARVGRDWARVWGNIQHYFVAENDVISNVRLMSELHLINTKRRVNAQHGALGGAAKALKEKKLALANATVSLQQPEPYLERERKNKQKEFAFGVFWKVWPNKVARAGAEKAWRKLSEHDRKSVLAKDCAGFTEWRAANKTANPIHAASFLNGKRWEDETVNHSQQGNETDRWRKIAGREMQG